MGARLLRHGRAVRSCAGAYVFGAAGSNECPAGSVRIETEAACRAAAAAAGKTVDSAFVETEPAYPRGCYNYIFAADDTVYFNTHAVGAGGASSRLLCAAAVTTGAPPRALRGRRGRRAAAYGVRHYASRAHGALTAYSAGLAGSASVGRALHAVWGADVSRSVGQCIAPWRALAVCGRGTSCCGTHEVLHGVCCSWVLTGYS
jgi:hypothetical protein